jgi:integrase/recombinase XerD
MNSPSRNSVSTHANGQVYRPAVGRAADRDAIEDHRSNNRSVVKGMPSPDEFLTIIRRELRIRFYQQNTIKSYIQAVTGFLSWFGRLPHQVTSEDVREYLEVMLDGGASSSHTGVALSAIRKAFDKMCQRQVTLGLVIPRKPKRLPVVLNMAEVRLMIEASRSMRDKLVLGPL